MPRREPASTSLRATRLSGRTMGRKAGLRCDADHNGRHSSRRRAWRVSRAAATLTPRPRWLPLACLLAERYHRTVEEVKRLGARPRWG